MPANRFGGGAVALACTILLGACRTVGPDVERPRVPSLEHWNGGSLASLAQAPGARRAQLQLWWRHFHDPVLDQLVALAQRANPNVRTAGLRIMEARAELGIATSGNYPQVQQVNGQLLQV